MFFWAVVSDEINRVIEFFPTRRQAEKMLAEALRDEPDWQAVLRVEKIEFRAGTANEPAAALPQASGSYPLPRGRRDCSAPYPRWEE